MSKSKSGSIFAHIDFTGDTLEFELEKKKNDKCSIDNSRVSMKDKERIISAYTKGADHIELGYQLGIKRSTVQSIITLWKKYGILSKGKQGGYKKSLISDNIGRELMKAVEDNPLLQIKEMKRLLKGHNLSPTDQTVSNYLHGRCIAIKTPTISQAVADTIECYNGCLTLDTLHPNSVFIDECIFNFWMKRAYGRSQKVERVYRHSCGQKGTNVTVRVAFDKHEMRCYEIFTNGSDPILNNFLLQMPNVTNDTNIIVSKTFKAYNNQKLEDEVSYLPLVVLEDNHEVLDPVKRFFNKLRILVKQKIPGNQTTSHMALKDRKEVLRKTIITVLEKFFRGSTEEYFFPMSEEEQQKEEEVLAADSSDDEEDEEEEEVEENGTQMGFRELMDCQDDDEETNSSKNRDINTPPLILDGALITINTAPTSSSRLTLAPQSPSIEALTSTASALLNPSKSEPEVNTAPTLNFVETNTITADQQLVLEEATFDPVKQSTADDDNVNNVIFDQHPHNNNNNFLQTNNNNNNVENKNIVIIENNNITYENNNNINYENINNLNVENDHNMETNNNIINIENNNNTLKENVIESHDYINVESTDTMETGNGDNITNIENNNILNKDIIENYEYINVESNDNNNSYENTNNNGNIQMSNIETNHVSHESYTDI